MAVQSECAVCERVTGVPGTHAEPHHPCTARSPLVWLRAGAWARGVGEREALCARVWFPATASRPRSPVLTCADAVATCAGACLQVAVCDWGALVGFLRTTRHRPKGARGLSTCSMEGGGQVCPSCAPPFARFCPRGAPMAPACERKCRELDRGSLRGSSVFSWKPGCGSAAPLHPASGRLPPTPRDAASFSQAWPVLPPPRTFCGCPGSAAPSGPASPPCTRLFNLYTQIKGCLLLCCCFF